MKTEISSSLYCLLPETTETQFVKELSEILSEVRHDGWRRAGNVCQDVTDFVSALQNKYKEEGKKEMSSSLYSQLPETAEMQLAKNLHAFQSEVDEARRHI